MEAMEYEREAIKFDFDDWRSERRLSHAGFEDRNNFHGVIDRIDEEFGDDDANSLDTHVSGSYGRSPRSVSELPGVTGVVSSNHYLPSHQLYHAANAQFYDSELPATPFFKPYQQKYNDHTSQYASCDPAGYPYSIQVDSPGSPLLSGCYSDKTPSSTANTRIHSVCYKRSEAEFPDPNEERTYTTLLCETSSLLLNAMSPRQGSS